MVSFERCDCWNYNSRLVPSLVLTLLRTETRSVRVSFLCLMGLTSPKTLNRISVKECGVSGVLQCRTRALLANPVTGICNSLVFSLWRRRELTSSQLCN